MKQKRTSVLYGNQDSKPPATPPIVTTNKLDSKEQDTKVSTSTIGLARSPTHAGG